MKYGAILAVKKDSYYSYKRGVVYFLQGKYDDALTDFDNCTKWEQSSESFQAHYYRGLVYVRLALYGQAVEAYTTAMEVFSESTDANSPVLDSLRSTKRSISRFNHGVTASIIKTLHIKDTANVIEKQKHREQVEDAIDSLFHTKITKNDILNNRGLAHLSIGNYDEAISDLKQAGDSKHHFVFNLGYAYYFTRSKEAIECFQKAIQMAGENVPQDYQIYLGCALERSGDAKRAKQVRDNVLKHSPNAIVEPFHYKFLPDSVMLHLLSFVDHQVLAQVGRTCRTLYQMSKHESLYTSVWVPLTKRNNNHNYYEYFKQVMNIYSKKLEYLYIDDEYTNSISSFSQFVSNQKFKKVKMTTQLWDINEQVFAKNDCSELEELYLNDTSSRGVQSEKVLDSIEMPKLRKLVVKNCHFGDWDKVLSVCGANLILLEAPSIDQGIVFKHCPQLCYDGETRFVPKVL